jgi:hypothetical protein
MLACFESAGGIALLCVCTPCVLGNDPQDEATAAVLNWANAGAKTDACRIDAMQHCVGAAMLAWDCTATCTICAGEVGEWLQEDGDPMDLWNNEKGVHCAADSTQEIVECCEAKLNTGELRTDGNCL